MNRQISWLLLVIFINLYTTAANADLVVYEDLGTVIDTVIGRHGNNVPFTTNNAQSYLGQPEPTHVYLRERVFQFSLDRPQRLLIQEFEGFRTDYFLLDSLAVAGTQATGVLSNSAMPGWGNRGIRGPGTYYVSAANHYVDEGDPFVTNPYRYSFSVSALDYANQSDTETGTMPLDGPTFELLDQDLEPVGYQSHYVVIPFWLEASNDIGFPDGSFGGFYEVDINASFPVTWQINTSFNPSNPNLGRSEYAEGKSADELVVLPSETQLYLILTTPVGQASSDLSFSATIGYGPSGAHFGPVGFVPEPSSICLLGVTGLILLLPRSKTDYLILRM